ncbi:MAG: hypothetical protein GXX09_02865 [Syntrophomonadaceae bacterium]|nr:hypothetical protein [Syntrophomonadaceae bacterium]
MSTWYEKYPWLANDRSLLALHLFLCSIGLLGVTGSLTGWLGSSLLEDSALHLKEWATPFYPGKRLELLQYCAGAASLFVYYTVIYAWSRRVNGEFESRFYRYLRGSAPRLVTYLVAVPASNLLLAWQSSHEAGRALLGTWCWLLILLLPFLTVPFTFSVVGDRWNRWLAKLDKVYYVILVLVVAQFVNVFLPLVGGELKMINEWLDIPEMTRLRDGYVDNADYLNRHQLLGTHRRYDLEEDRGESPAPREANHVHIPATPELARFIDRHETRYYYDEKRQALCVTGAMTARERDELLAACPDEAGRRAILDLYHSSNAAQKAWEQRRLTDEEEEFLKKNGIELGWQVANNWVLHHHYFILGPVNEYALGKPLREINLQYGWMNMVAIKHLLEWMGGVSYQNYFRLWHALYYVYYGLFLGLLFLLCKKIRYVLLVSVLAGGAINYFGFVILFMSPGWSPVRHFFDVFVIAFLYLYLTRDKVVFLLLSLAAGLLGLANDSVFGLVGLLAWLVTLAFRGWNEPGPARRRDLLLAGLGAAAGLAGLVFFPGGRNVMLPYYLQGLLASPLKAGVIMACLVLSSAGYAVLVKYAGARHDLKYPALFLLCYSQGLLVYYIWNTSNYHFLSLAPIFALTAVVFLKFMLESTGAGKRYENLVVAAAVGLALVAYLPSLFVYYCTRQFYYQVFDNHKVYQWSLDRATFKSTMNPKYFTEAVELLQQYTPGQSSVYIVSKYDNFLPFLAEKYSAMPFFEASRFLVTEREVIQCIQAIEQAKPEYLFVDTDIERNLNVDIVDSKARYVGFLHDESVARVQRLKELQHIYQQVKDDYQPLEKGYLLTVYHRKQGDDLFASLGGAER